MRDMGETSVSRGVYVLCCVFLRKKLIYFCKIKINQHLNTQSYYICNNIYHILYNGSC